MSLPEERSRMVEIGFELVVVVLVWLVIVIRLVEMRRGFKRCM